MTRALGVRPRLHPNGFVQLDLREDPTGNLTRDRLHVWPEEGRVAKQASDNTIHDHNFDMRSTVLLGAIAQMMFDVRLHHNGSPSHEIYVALHTDEHNTSLVPTRVRAYVSRPTSHLVLGGQTYAQPAFTFHDTEVKVRPAATLMSKTHLYDDDAMRVLVPVGEEPDNEFDRLGASEEELWQIIEEAITW